MMFAVICAKLLFHQYSFCAYLFLSLLCQTDETPYHRGTQMYFPNKGL